MTSVLEVTNLSLSVGDGDQQRLLLDQVTFSVTEGESVGIVGESGSGKTLTLRGAIGLFPPHSTVSGSIRLGGVSILKASESELRQLRLEEASMIFQDPHAAINPVYRIEDFLTETFRSGSRASRAEARVKAGRLLQQVQISDPERVLQSYPHQLSGGMLQRVMIASTLMRDPRIVLADEPTTALDVTTQSEVLALLDDVRKVRNTALVLITHDLEVVSAIADRILVMYRGRFVEEVTPQQLVEGTIRHPYTRALLSCRPDVFHRQERLPVVAREQFEIEEPAP